MIVSPFQAHTDQSNHIKQSPYKSSLIVTCSNDKTIKIWNLFLIWILIRNYTDYNSGVSSFDFIDENIIVSGSFETIIIWSIGTGVTLKTS